jgi:thioredoxin reductase
VSLNGHNVRPLDTLLNPASLRRNERGYIEVDSDGRTSIDGVYAAGDVCNEQHPCVATALAAGTIVARTIERDQRTELLHGRSQVRVPGATPSMLPGRG